ALSTLPAMATHADGYSHRPYVEYGSGYGHRSHTGHYQSRRYGHSRKHDHHGYALLGGLVLGAMLVHSLSRRGPHYAHYSYPETNYRPAPPPYWNAPAYVPGRYQQRLVLELDGNCYLVSGSASGGEVWSPRALADCY
ncbi:MAG: hypothetical protein OES26_22790, partial [Gammaproteobacteria bacterium]|nr:hypothetical protein [Gammaproteobacteria bacterium]